MNIFSNRSTKIFIFIIGSGCLLMPVNGFSEDQSAGFYAGPLSVVAETVVEVKSEKPLEDEAKRLKEEKIPAEEIKKAREVSNPAEKTFEGLPHGQ